jgi:hypothetical protein
MGVVQYLFPFEVHHTEMKIAGNGEVQHFLILTELPAFATDCALLSLLMPSFLLDEESCH